MGYLNPKPLAIVRGGGSVCFFEFTEAIRSRGNYTFTFIIWWVPLSYLPFLFFLSFLLLKSNEWWIGSLAHHELEIVVEPALI